MSQRKCEKVIFFHKNSRYTKLYQTLIVGGYGLIDGSISIPTIQPDQSLLGNLLHKFTLINLYH